MSRRRLVVVLAAVVVAASACSGGSEDDKGPTGSAGYVALGDSFVSGPLLGAADPDQPGCLRSTANYAHQLAATMPDLGFRDVSCGGEDTVMLRDGRTLADGTAVPPQLTSVGRDTTLVTIGIGANDAAATAGLYQYCLLPATANDAECDTFTSTYMPKVYPKTLKAVASVLGEIKQRAPRAEVHLVGYQRIAPDAGQASCAALPLSDARRDAVAGYEQTMNATLAKAARRADVPFVDMYTASQGHDVCSGDAAWVNGIANSPTGDGAFLHPTAAGMTAVLEALEQSVEG